MPDPTYACPDCAGPWLYGFTFRHARFCPLLPPEDGRRAADRDLLAARLGSVVRDCTPTEVRLAEVFDPDVHERVEDGTRVQHQTPSILRRVVAGVDPDLIADNSLNGDLA